MANKRHKPEEIVKKLRQVDVLVGQGMMRVDAIREVCIWWRNANLWRGVRDRPANRGGFAQWAIYDGWPAVGEFARFS